MQRIPRALGALLTSSLIANVALPANQVFATFADTAPATRYGGAVDGTGDCNGDGVPDVVVGAYRGAGGKGEVICVSGSDSSVLWSRAGTGSGWFGFAVSGVGDLDSDGRNDVLVGAPLAAGGAGTVTALRGTDGTPLWTVSGGAPGARLGQSVAGLDGFGPGDIDGDGIPDLAAGAPFDSSGGTYAGRVDLLSGADGSLLHTDLGAPFDQFGLDVAGVGDLDGDGAPDCAVGAPFDDRGGFNAGAVTVISGASGGRLFDLLGSTPGDWLGHEVAGAGDVDRDGTADILASLPGADANGFDSGAVQVHSGAHGGVLFTIPAEAPGLYAEAVCGPGDVDGDGAADILVGASASGSSQAGRIRLISGRTQGEICRFDGATPEAWLGAAVARIGDVDGDGFPDLCAGAPGHDDNLTLIGYVQLMNCARGIGITPRKADPRPPGTATQAP